MVEMEGNFENLDSRFDNLKGLKISESLENVECGYKGVWNDVEVFFVQVKSCSNCLHTWADLLFEES